MPTNTLDIPALAAEFTAAHPELDPSGQRVVLATSRLLGEGAPVTYRAIAERTERALAEVATYLDQGRDARAR